MRLVFVMECVLALGVGVSLARETRPVDFTPMSNYALAFAFVGFRDASRFAVGVGLVMGMGTWLEGARRHAPDVWGPGRWVMSVMAAWILFAFAAKIGRYYGNGLFLHIPSTCGVISTVFDGPDKGVPAVALDDPYVAVVAAVVATGIVCRSSRRALADAREWAGRIYAGLIIVCGFANMVICYIYN